MNIFNSFLLNLLILCYIKMDNDNYFDLKYLEEIHFLFLELKEISQFYNLNFFQKNNKSSPFHEFINNNIEIIEYDTPISDDEILYPD